MIGPLWLSCVVSKAYLVAWKNFMLSPGATSDNRILNLVGKIKLEDIFYFLNSFESKRTDAFSYSSSYTIFFLMFLLF